MSMFNDVDWARKGEDLICFSNSEMPRNTRRDSRKAAARFRVLEIKRSGMEFFLTHFKENWILQPLKWCHSGRNPIDSTLQDNVLIPNNFFEYFLSYWICSQFTLHHKFWIDSGRTKFKQGQTDGILHSRESHGQESQRSARAWFDQTTSCIVQPEVEKIPGHGVLGRYTACSTKRIEVLSNKIERKHPLRYTPSLLYLESNCDEIWRNHIPESVCVTSTTTDDFPYTPEGKRDSAATQMVEQFKDTGHPVFKSIRALHRGILKKKNGRDTTHFIADAWNTELLFRIIHSVNQFGIYGAVTTWCKQFGLTKEQKGQDKQKNPWPKLCWHVWKHKK